MYFDLIIFSFDQTGECTVPTLNICPVHARSVAPKVRDAWVKAKTKPNAARQLCQ
jgi:hypothetical protein